MGHDTGSQRGGGVSKVGQVVGEFIADEAGMCLNPFNANVDPILEFRPQGDGGCRQETILVRDVSIAQNVANVGGVGSESDVRREIVPG